MRAELLYKIADIINSNSTKYRAVIPRVRRQYMTQQGDKLVKSTCLVLNIMVTNRPKNHINRSIWNIYENDMDRIIKRLLEETWILHSGLTSVSRHCLTSKL